MADVLLVEDTRSDASLAAIAIALRHPRVRVYEAQGMKDALDALARRRRPTVVILAWRALRELPGQLPRDHGRFVGFAANLTEQEKRRALDAGAEAIHERPAEWRAFCDALERLLDEYLGAAARP